MTEEFELAYFVSLQEMERFREHEKEFKMKQYSKKALQHFRESGNYGSDEEGSDYGDEQDSYGEDEDEEQISSADQLARDKEWL